MKSGKYVSAVDIDNGTIDITYGIQANAATSTATCCRCEPLVSPNCDVIWVCGTREVPSGAGDPSAGAARHRCDHADGCNNKAKYVPANCRAST